MHRLRFDYRIVKGVYDVAMTSRPGDATWRYAGGDHEHTRRPEPPSGQSAQIYAALGEAEARGVVVTRDADAADNDWLKATFGDEVAYSRVQHADGRAEPITVFRVRAGLDRSYDPVACGDEAAPFDIGGITERKYVGELALLRGGNTIVVVERCGAR